MVISVSLTCFLSPFNGFYPLLIDSISSLASTFFAVSLSVSICRPVFNIDMLSLLIHKLGILVLYCWLFFSLNAGCSSVWMLHGTHSLMLTDRDWSTIVGYNLRLQLLSELTVTACFPLKWHICITLWYRVIDFIWYEFCWCQQHHDNITAVAGGRINVARQFFANLSDKYKQNVLLLAATTGQNRRRPSLTLNREFIRATLLVLCR